MFFVEGGKELFEAAGFSALTPDDAIHGKLGARFFSMYSLEQYQRLCAEGKISPEVFLRDYQTEQYLQLAEKNSNSINAWLMNMPEMSGISEMLETHLHHGRNHFRRVEKEYKRVYKYHPQLRADSAFVRFAPSSYLAIRFHDLPEMHTGLKEHHDGAGAMFAYGLLPKAYELINQVVLDSGGTDFVSYEAWEKQRYATAFICLYHSKPEKMPSVDLIMKSGGVLFNPMHLLDESKKMAALEGKRLEDFFPGYAVISDVIANMQRGYIDVPIRFSREEVTAIRDQSFAMSFADKMDSNHPPGLSTSRTFLVRPERSFVLPELYDGMSLMEEIQARKADGGGHEAEDDMNRFIFELTREPNWGNLPLGLRRDFMRSLYEKGKFMQKATHGLLEGDFSPFAHAYDDIRRNAIESTLLKAKVNTDEVNRILRTRDLTWCVEQAIMTLHQRGYRGGKLIRSILDAIQFEESNVQSAIREKYIKIQHQHLSDAQKKRIHDILAAIVEWQRLALLSYSSSSESGPDWWKDGYYFIPLEAYRNTKMESK